MRESTGQQELEVRPKSTEDAGGPSISELENHELEWKRSLLKS